MYGQANYGPKFGQGPQAPGTSPYQQHPPPLPPPPPPPTNQLQKGSLAPMPPMIQQGPPGVTPRMNQPGAHLYQHCLPASSPPIHSGLPVQAPSHGMPKTGDSFINPPSSLHGSNSGPQTYSSIQHTQHASHFGAQSVHQNTSLIPPQQGPPRPPLLPGSLPPPPPLSQGQTSYRTTLPLPPRPPGAVLGPLPLPTTTSGFCTPTGYGSSTQSVIGHSHSPFVAPSSSEINSKGQPNNVKASADSDSDMEMEDDITLVDFQEVKHLTETLDCNSDLNLKELDVQEQLHARNISSECRPVQAISSENVSRGSLNVYKQSKEANLLNNDDQSTLRSALEVRSHVTHSVGASECLQASNLEKTLPPLADNLHPSSASVAAEDINSKKLTEPMKDGSSISFLQDYASDEGSENDSGLLHKDITSLEVPLPPPKGTGTTDGCLNDIHGDQASVKFSTSHVASQKKDALDSPAGHVISNRDKSLRETEERKAKFEVAPLQVDEFGRLVREGSSDTDSDSRYNKRRERSRSRSRSPRRRNRSQRSSRRRRERRSQSRSLSPRKQRSRNRSPPYRRAVEFSGENLRSDRGHIPICFDFRQGRCARGRSCRYRHREVDKNDSMRRNRSKPEYREVPPENDKTKEDLNNKAILHEMQDGKVDCKREDIVGYSQQSIIADQSGQLTGSDIVKCQSPESIAGSVQEKQSVDSFPLVETPGIHHSRSKLAVAEVHYADSPDQTSLISPKKLSDRELQNNILPTDSLPNASSFQAASSEPVFLQFPCPKESSLSNYSSPNIPHHALQLPPPPPLPLNQGISTSPIPLLPVDYSSMPQVASYPLQSAHAGNLHTYQPSLPKQHPPFSLPPNSSWSSLPPPPPLPSNDSRFSTGTATSSVSSQFQHNHFPPRNDSSSQISTLLPRAYPSMQESHQPNLHLEDLRPGNLPNQLFGAPGSLREDRFTHPPVQDLNTSSSLGQSSLHQQSVPSSQELSNHTDFVGSRVLAHFNPYASTFDQSLSFKFSSDTIGQGKSALIGNKYDPSFSLSHIAADGQGVGNFGSRQTTSSPSSARAVAQVLPTFGSDQYDPLFDSIEQSSNASKKREHGQKWDPSADSDIEEKHSGSHKLLDSEENNRDKAVAAVAAVASTSSPDNDEYGETADAEVGDVENESQSNVVGVDTEGEIATKKSPGKKKKKDSRSMKLFKIAIADFVKDILKPSWRQGNMSKESFKTIVKKTVDKVSGAMKGKRVPKSQEKINQYIESSQRKLTKLVMGYVDKYVKL